MFTTKCRWGELFPRNRAILFIMPVEFWRGMDRDWDGWAELWNSFDVAWLKLKEQQKGSWKASWFHSREAANIRRQNGGLLSMCHGEGSELNLWILLQHQCCGRVHAVWSMIFHVLPAASFPCFWFCFVQIRHRLGPWMLTTCFSTKLHLLALT